MINRASRVLESFTVNPSNYAVFDPKFQSDLRGVKLFCVFFLIGASTTKRFARSRNFKYGLTKDILNKGQKTKAGGGELQVDKLKTYTFSFNIQDRKLVV